MNKEKEVNAAKKSIVVVQKSSENLTTDQLLFGQLRNIQPVVEKDRTEFNKLR